MKDQTDKPGEYFKDTNKGRIQNIIGSDYDDFPTGHDMLNEPWFCNICDDEFPNFDTALDHFHELNNERTS